VISWLIFVGIFSVMFLCNCACSSVADEAEFLSPVDDISDLFDQQDDEAAAAAAPELS